MQIGSAQIHACKAAGAIIPRYAVLHDICPDDLLMDFVAIGPFEVRRRVVKVLLVLTAVFERTFSVPVSPRR